MRFIILLVTLFFCMNASHRKQHAFYGGYCSMYTESGEWDIAYGEHSVEFYCMIVAHRLGRTYSPIVEKSVGTYDMYDLNTVTVTCQDEGHSFEVHDFGSYGIMKAVFRAEDEGGTSCLFTVKPDMFNKIGTILLGDKEEFFL